MLTGARRRPPGVARRSGTGGPIDRRLFLGTLAGLLPLALLAFGTLAYTARAQRDTLLAQAGNTMRAMSSAVDTELEEALASLDVLAASPRLARGDYAGFHAEARGLLERRTRWFNIVLSTPAAEQVVNARLEYGEPLPRRVDPQSVAETVRTGRPGVSDMVYSPLLGTYAFAARVPVTRNGRVAYVLTAVIRPEAVRGILAAQELPAGAVASVFDRRYHVVARSLDHEQRVGRPGSAGLVALLDRGERSGHGITHTLEGREVHTVYYRSPLTGWSAVVGLSIEQLDAPVRRSYAVLGGALLLSGALGFFIAVRIGRTITDPMRELAAAAADVAEGRVPVVPPSSLPEVRQVGEALERAHRERQQVLDHEREARAMERSARLMAEGANRSKDEFLAVLGHELRNPLAAIMSAARVLEHRDRITPAQLDESVAVIHRQVGNAARLTDDLLDVARVTLGKIRLDLRVLDLATVATGAVEALRRAGRLDRHAIHLECRNAWVRGDPARLEQVVANLVANAVKFTPPGGVVRIAVGTEDGRAVLTVQDTGRGVDPELLARMFDLFVQGEPSLNRLQDGLGVGLALVRRLVESHQGDVRAFSDGPGQGTRIVVRLPAVEPERREAADAVPATAARSVVIVEDNADVRSGVRHLLELHGHAVHEAADGQAGVEAIARVRPDVAIIDIGVPELDGFSVAREVRRTLGAGVRLIALSGYGVAESSGDAAEFDAYLVKPVDDARLVRLVAG